MITITIGDKMTPLESQDLEKMKETAMRRAGDVEEIEDENYAAASPKGRFTPKGLNVLVDASNKLAPLFGIDDKYPKFTGIEPLTTLPPEFVRLLSMFGKAIGDAVEADVLPSDATVDLMTVTDDNGLQSLAGRIGMAASSPQMKKFLLRKVMKTGAEEMNEKEMEGMEEEAAPLDTDKLFKGRM
jgi:hypothetical protein